VIAKTGGNLVRAAQRGVSYLTQSIVGSSSPIQLLPVVLANVAVVTAVAVGIGLCVSNLLRAKAVNVYALLAMLSVAAYIAFIVFSGGDWMEGGRFIAQLLPVCMIFAAVALVSVMRSDRRRRSALTGLVLCQLVFAFYFARDASMGMPIWNAIDSYRKLWA